MTNTFMNYVLLAEDSNVALKLDVITVGPGYQKIELKYKPTMMLVTHCERKERRVEGNSSSSSF